MATQHVAATSLDTADTAAFTRGLATASQAGTHPHITGLVRIYLQYLVSTVSTISTYLHM